jgi:hypothetical protein
LVEANRFALITASRACLGHPQGCLLPDGKVRRCQGYPTQDLKRLHPALPAKEGKSDRQLGLGYLRMLWLEEEEALKLPDGAIIFSRFEQRLREGEQW